MSTLKVDNLTSKTDDTDCVLSAHGSGKIDIETAFKVSGTLGLPLSDIRTSSGTASASTFLRGDGTWNAPTAAAGSVYLSAYVAGGSQSIARATWTDVTTWTAEYLDSATAFNTTTGVFTFPSVGKYLMIADVAANFDGVGDDGEQMYIRFVDGNANNYAQQRWITNSTTNIRYGTIGTSIMGAFASAATIKIQIQHLDSDASGGNTSIDYANFVIMKVAD